MKHFWQTNSQQGEGYSGGSNKPGRAADVSIGRLLPAHRVRRLIEADLMPGS